MPCVFPNLPNLVGVSNKFSLFQLKRMYEVTKKICKMFSYVLLIYWKSFCPSGEIPALKAVINFFFRSICIFLLSSSFWIFTSGMGPPGDSLHSSSTFISAQLAKFKIDTLWWLGREPGIPKKQNESTIKMWTKIHPYSCNINYSTYILFLFFWWYFY